MLTVSKDSKDEMFNLSAGPLRELLSELIEQGLVNGNPSAMDADRSAQDNSRNLGSDARLEDLNNRRLGRERGHHRPQSATSGASDAGGDWFVTSGGNLLP